MKFLCRPTEHDLSDRVLLAFAEGTPRTLTLRCGLRVDIKPDEIPVYYGILRGCAEAIKEDMKAGRPFVYIDHGYFGDTDNVRLSGHYRIVVGGLHPRIPEWPKSDKLVVAAAERQIKLCDPMILVPPSAPVADFYGVDVADWIRRFRAVFPRVVISSKTDNNLDSLLENCRGVFTHSSTAAVKALCMGLPAWCTAERAPVPNHAKCDRIGLLAWLAERQFTLEEIRNGRHLQFLGRQIEEFRAENSPGIGHENSAGSERAAAYGV